MRAQIVRELKGMAQLLRPPRNRARGAGASVSSAELDARGIPSGRPGAVPPPQQQQLPAGGAPRPAAGNGAGTPGAPGAASLASTMVRAGTMRPPVLLGTLDEQKAIVAAAQHPGVPRRGSQSHSGGSNTRSDGNKPAGDAKPAADGKPASDGKPAADGKAVQSAEGEAAHAAASAVVAAIAEQAGPGTPPEQAPSTEGISREHSEEPAKAAAAQAAQRDQAAQVSAKLGGLALRGGAGGNAPPQPRAAQQQPDQGEQVSQDRSWEKVPPPAPASAPQQQPPALVSPFQPNPFSSAFAYTERMNSAFSSG